MEESEKQQAPSPSLDHGLQVAPPVLNSVDVAIKRVHGPGLKINKYWQIILAKICFNVGGKLIHIIES